jgi:enoyl-CoA hydratase/carnithine racemase
LRRHDAYAAVRSGFLASWASTTRCTCCSRDASSPRRTLLIGLVSEIVSSNCDWRAIEIAEEIAALPPLTVMQIKDAVLSGADIPLSITVALSEDF